MSKVVLLLRLLSPCKTLWLCVNSFHLSDGQQQPSWLSPQYQVIYLSGFVSNTPQIPYANTQQTWYLFVLLNTFRKGSTLSWTHQTASYLPHFPLLSDASFPTKRSKNWFQFSLEPPLHLSACAISTREPALQKAVSLEPSFWSTTGSASLPLSLRLSWIFAVMAWHSVIWAPDS